MIFNKKRKKCFLAYKGTHCQSYVPLCINPLDRPVKFYRSKIFSNFELRWDDTGEKEVIKNIKGFKSKKSCLKYCNKLNEKIKSYV